MSPLAHLILLVLSCAAWLTLHAQLLWLLTMHPPRLQALPAWLLPPLAPAFAWQRGAKRRAGAWALCAATYLGLRASELL